MSKMVRLTARATLMVCSEEDVDREPEARSVVVPAAVWHKAVALAETTSGFRAPRGDFMPTHTRTLALALRQALDAVPEQSTSARHRRHLTVRGQLDDFFAVPANRKALLAILRLVESGGSLEITTE